MVPRSSRLSHVTLIAAGPPVLLSFGCGPRPLAAPCSISLTVPCLLAF